MGVRRIITPEFSAAMVAYYNEGIGNSVNDVGRKFKISAKLVSEHLKSVGVYRYGQVVNSRARQQANKKKKAAKPGKLAQNLFFKE